MNPLFIEQHDPDCSGCKTPEGVQATHYMRKVLDPRFSWVAGHTEECGIESQQAWDIPGAPLGPCNCPHSTFRVYRLRWFIGRTVEDATFMLTKPNPHNLKRPELRRVEEATEFYKYIIGGWSYDKAISYWKQDGWSRNRKDPQIRHEIPGLLIAPSPEALDAGRLDECAVVWMEEG